MSKSVRISLANKCQLLFGGAVVLILTAALGVVWMRMQVLVREEQAETARKLADAWLAGMVSPRDALVPLEQALRAEGPDQNLTITLIEKDELGAAAQRDRFLADGRELFETLTDRREHFTAARDVRGEVYYRYARALRRADLLRLQRSANGAAPSAGGQSPLMVNPLESILLIQFRSDLAQRQLMLNRIYIVGAGLIAGVMAIGAFWVITTRVILSPLRVLRDTAQKVSAGDINIRSDVNTGDEFEQLSDMYNRMLESLKNNQDQLRSINKSLDLKLGELAEHNVALYEANKIKGEFLANVSHELRTPLNSIVGFAEVLQETMRDQGSPLEEKRRRYVSNIILSSRRLLDLINELLDLAKIEAGRMDVRVGPMSMADTAEGLVNLIRPQADKKQVRIETRIAPDIPIVQTDASKFQQILFNFLSNAVKFTPEGGTVTLSAALAPPANPEVAGAAPRLRASVSDTGPGIPPDQQERIFEKFTQLAATVTKEHGGTGLGLTISRELAQLLQGEIHLDSLPGKGATFSLLIPLAMQSTTVPLMPNLSGAARADAATVA